MIIEEGVNNFKKICFEDEIVSKLISETIETIKIQDNKIARYPISEVNKAEIE